MLSLKNTKHATIRVAYSRAPEQTGSPARRKIYARRIQHAAGAHEEATKSPIASGDEVLEELSKIARANALDFMGVGANGGLVLDFNKLTRAQAAAITEVNVEYFPKSRSKSAREVSKVTFKFSDKLRALKMLSQHHGLFTEQKSFFTPDIAERLKAAIARVDGKKEKPNPTES